MNVFVLLRIFIPGGIMSYENLNAVIVLAKKFGIRNIQFGLRQDINITVERYQMDDLKLYMENQKFDYEFNSDWSRNIVTSYVSNRVFPSESWLTEKVYKDILNRFDFKPKVRINIVDPNQGLVPLFTGHFNFIASSTKDFWYLYLDADKWFKGVTAWPFLIHTNDISSVSKNLESLYNSNEFSNDSNSKSVLVKISEKINTQVKGSHQKVEKESSIPYHLFPYYEGFNKAVNEDKYWIGLYKRSYQFPIDFLEAMNELCHKEGINAVSISPWRSLLIKDIKETDSIKWMKLLGQFGINIRHSSLELNWRIPDFDSFAIELKQYLVSEFDRNDIRTYGLTFAIRTQKVDLDAIIVIERVPAKSMFRSKQIEGNYNIYFTKNFDANQKEYIKYAEEISYSSLPKKLQELTAMYYEQLKSSN